MHINPLQGLHYNAAGRLCFKFHIVTNLNLDFRDFWGNCHFTLNVSLVPSSAGDCVAADGWLSGTKMALGSSVFEWMLCDRPDIYC